MARKISKSTPHCKNLISAVDSLQEILDEMETCIREDTSANIEEREADLALVDRQRKAFNRWKKWWESDIARNELAAMPKEPAKKAE